MHHSRTHHSGLEKNGGCWGFRVAQRISRREALRIGGLTGLGLTLSDLLRQRAGAAEQQTTVADRPSSFGKAKRIIMLYLHGGHPQQETFDPKPQGPSSVRGEFGAISTSVPGVGFSELLPQTARIMDRLAIIRSMSHDNANHVTASLPANTGHRHPPNVPKTDFPPASTDFPPYGAVLGHLRPRPHSRPQFESRSLLGELPAWVRVGPLMRRNNGTVLHGQLPGFLGAKHASFVVDQELLADGVKIEAVQPNSDLTSVRFSARRNLLEQFDQQRELLGNSLEARDLDDFYQRAFSLLGSSQTRIAFDLAAESPAARARYGRTEFGQRCLLARRLAEAGVPMVNVSYCHTPRGSWDTHSQNFVKMKDSLGPTLDTALSALVEDLDQRGLLAETLVVVNAEFGRTPKINRSAGRDHWPWVYSLALAGAGIRPATVYGSSDDSAAYPASNPHDQRDFAATIYHLLGVSADTLLYDAVERPHQLVIGKPIDGILA